MGLDVMGWDGLGLDGMRWDGMRWNEMERDGMGIHGERWRIMIVYLIPASLSSYFMYLEVHSLVLSYYIL